VEAASQALHRGNIELANDHLGRAPERLRGWEWRHLDSRCNTTLRQTKLGDGYTIPRPGEIAWSASGDRFAVLAGRPDGSLDAVWIDAESLRVVDELHLGLEDRSHQSVYLFNGSGSRLLLGRNEGGAFVGRILGSTGGDVLESFELPASDAGGPGTIRIVERGGFLLAFVGGQWRSVDTDALADHPEFGRIAVLHSGDIAEQSLVVVEVDTGRVIRRMPIVGGGTRKPVFAQGGAVALIHGDHGVFEAFDVERGEPMPWSPLSLAPLQVHMTEPSPDGEAVYLGTVQGIVTSVEVETGGTGVRHRGLLEFVRAIGVRPGTRELFSVQHHGNVNVWDAARVSPFILRRHRHWVEPLTVSGDGRMLATGDWEGSLRLWDTRSLDQILEIRVPRSDGRYTVVESIDFSPDGARVALVRSGGWTTPHHVEERDVKTGEKIRDLMRIPKGLAWVRYHPDGRVFVSSMDESGERLADGVVHIGGVSSSVSFSPTDSSRSAVVTQTNTPEALRVFDNTTMETEYETAFRIRRARALEFSPDGTRIAAVHARAVRIFRASDGAVVGELRGHPDEVFDAAWSPDGRRLATASRDYTIGIWDASSLRMITPLFGHTDFVDRVAWSPDGRVLYSTSHDGTVRVWSDRAAHGR